MAVQTKWTLMEQVRFELAGGDPKAATKFEPRMIMQHIEQAINKRLKTEYFDVLKGDNTIPTDLVLACYDNIPVVRYKGVLSRAQLPALPVRLPKGMGVFFVGPATSLLDTEVSIQSAPVSLPVGIGQSVTYNFVVTRAGGLTGISQFSYVVSGTGSNPALQAYFFGGSYPFGIVTFAVGETSKTISVTVLPNLGIIDPSEFLVTIGNQNPASDIIDNNTCVGIITVARIFTDIFDQTFN